jgi:hypothetical protein
VLELATLAKLQRIAPWPHVFRVIGFGLGLIGIVNGFYGICFWILRIVQAMGFSTRMTGLVERSLI